MLIETKPNIKVIKLTGVDGEDSFEIPANHAIIAAYVKNNGTADRFFQANPGGAFIFHATLVPNEWVLATVVKSLFDTVVEPTIFVQDGFTDVDLDILVVLVDLSI